MNRARLAAMIVATLAVYLAARIAGPMASALAAGLSLGGFGLALARQVEELRRSVEHESRLARLDDLTGLANDRSFREALREHGPRAGQTLALIDLDRFKAFNDSFGHHAGDAALKEIGAILAGFAVGSTRVYRVGGDEFAVIFPAMEGIDPVEAVESIRRAVADHRWPLRPITVSIGLALAADGERGALFERADRSLYGAKRGGGDRAVVQEIEGLPSG